MKNYAIPICLVLFFFLVLISCEQKARKLEANNLETDDQKASNPEAIKLDKPPDRGKIDETRRIEKVVDGNTVICTTGSICVWNDSTNAKADLKPLYFTVEECEIPCTFTKGCNDEGDFVRFKRIPNTDSVKITAYEFKKR